MAWERLGRIFVPDDSGPSWMRSHAGNCVALPIADDLIRIYFTTRDASNRSNIAWLDFSINERRVLDVAASPVLGPGDLGAFDDSGTTLGWIVREGSLILIYYVGWNLGVTVPFRNSIGLAISHDGMTAERYSPAPVLDRSATDPYSLSYPCVLQAGSEWKMWYGSNLDWKTRGNQMQHVIKVASSVDGRRWEPTGRIALNVSGGDLAFSRPSVLLESGVYRMWYSFRGDAYRIGYAESHDGERWSRIDSPMVLGPSGEGWDSDEVEYPFVFRHDGELFMLYNGNGYGATGFGIARYREGGRAS